MGEELYTVRRWIAYCHSTQRYVNQEISLVGMNEKKDLISTCTGIEDCCCNCLFLLGSQSVKESNMNPSTLFIQISKTNKFL